MRIREIHSLIGPNIHHETSILAAELDPGGLGIDSPAEFPELMNRVRAHFPEMAENAEARRSWARCVEAIATALSERSGIARHTRKRARQRTERIAVLPFLCERSTASLLEAAARCIRALHEGRAFDAEEAIARAQKIFARRPVSLSLRALMQVAEERRIPWMPLHHRNLVQLGYGKNRRLLQATRTDGTSLIAGDMAANKQFAKEVLETAKVPVPRGASVSNLERAFEAIRELSPPWVVKPQDGHQGLGITMGVRDAETLESAFLHAREYSEKVLIEETFEGIDFRALVIDGKLVAVCRMIPAHVIGDGIRTIRELVERENLNPLRGNSHSFPLMRLRLGPEELDHLARSSRSPETIPPAGELVELRKNSNGSMGGSPLDVTARAHPEIRALCERTARVIGLDVCGIDLIVKDIAHPIRGGDRCGIIEINSRPGLHGHLRPGEREPVESATRIIEMLFPSGRECRIPIVALWGLPRSSVLPLALEKTLLESGLEAGRTGSDGIFLGGMRLSGPGATHVESLRSLLMDPLAELAIAELEPAVVERHGLGIDACDVAAVWSLGTSPQSARLLFESVLPGGTLLLNSDDPEVMELHRSSPPALARRTLLLSADSGAFGASILSALSQGAGPKSHSNVSSPMRLLLMQRPNE